MTESVAWPLHIYQSLPSNWNEQLDVKLTEGGLFRVWTPGVIRDRPEVGHYSHDLGPERIAAFRAFFEDLKPWDLPCVDSTAPEEPEVRFVEGPLDDPRRTTQWVIDALPAEVVTILDAVHRLIDEAAASPRRVLSGSACWSARTFSTREPLRLEFTLTGKGIERLSFESPMSEGSYPDRLQLIIAPVATPERTGQRPTQLTLLPRVVSRPDHPKPYEAGPARVSLAPEESTRYAAKASVYLSPGEHRAVLLFDAGPYCEHVDHVAGVLAIELPPLHIVHR
jgi:hypothetical protein